jgi:GTP 3',8-cyclase
MNSVLEDSFGRIATDLRVSLTDKCNLRCTYCMPAEGLSWLPDKALLNQDELVHLVGLATTLLGVTSVRFTGGEPLIRRDVVEIIERIHRTSPQAELSMTTNGIGLEKLAESLATAGLHRVNVSLDSIRPDAFAELTRRNRLPQVLAGLRTAKAAGLTPIKVNAVLMRGVNDDQAVELLQWALAEDYQLRFIEQMPLDAQHSWRRDEMVTADETLSTLKTQFELTPAEETRGSAPAEKWFVNGGPHTVGVIASVTRPFCGDCNRVRLTADGQVRNCLFAREESDLKTALRSGASDAQLARQWQAAMAVKKAGHGIDDPSFLQPDRPMSAIGG